MRITCRYVKSDNIKYPPVLNDNEGKYSWQRKFNMLNIGKINTLINITKDHEYE